MSKFPRGKQETVSPVAVSSDVFSNIYTTTIATRGLERPTLTDLRLTPLLFSIFKELPLRFLATESTEGLGIILPMVVDVSAVRGAE